MSKPPPIPPASRQPFGGHEGQQEAESDIKSTENLEVPHNLHESDRQGDKKQNTTHQGYQQDR